MALEKDITLGEFLRHERERRGITIEQVASATKVGVKTLHALEADHYSELPAKPFIRGFVTSYCRFISLDAKEILGHYENFINVKSIERPNRDSGHSGYAFEKKDGEQQSRTILMIAIVGFVAFGGIAMLVLKPSLRHRHSSHLEKLRNAHNDAVQQKIGIQATSVLSASPIPIVLPSAGPSAIASPVASEATPLSQPSVQPSASVQAEIPHSNKPAENPLDPLDSGLTLKAEEIKHKVAFKILSDVWVRYQIDGRPMRKFIVRKGKSLVLRAQEGVRFQVSNPKSIRFSYNGQGYELMSQEKKMKEYQGNATLIFPDEKADSGSHLFVGEPPLIKTSDPEPESISQVYEPDPSPTP
jgi:cytoskeletal protein RodZ